MIADSSALIAYFRKQDVFHAIAVEMMESLDSLTVPDHILAETLTVLKIKEGAAIAIVCADFLTNSSTISLRPTHPSEFEATLGYFSKNRNNLSFIDTLLVILSKKENQPIMTFDKELQNIMKMGVKQ